MKSLNGHWKQFYLEVGWLRRTVTARLEKFQLTTFVGPSYCRAEMYADRVACCPLVSHAEYADEYADGTDTQTDGRTPDRYITLSSRRGQRNN